MRPKVSEDSLLADIRLDLRQLKNGYIKMFDEFDAAMALPAKERAEKLESFICSFKKLGEFGKLAELAERMECDAEDGKILELQLHAIHDAACSDMVEEFNLDGQHPDYTGALEALINGYEPAGVYGSDSEKLSDLGMDKR